MIADAIQKNIYPSPPARNLYLVSKNKPVNPLINSFLHFILNEGQSVIDVAGYIKQDSISLINERLKLTEI